MIKTDEIRALLNDPSTAGIPVPGCCGRRWGEGRKRDGRTAEECHLM